MASPATTRRLFDRKWTTSDSLHFFHEHRGEFGEFVEADAFFHDVDAILAGYYDVWEPEPGADARFRRPATARLVLRDRHGAELWLGGCNCGYGGTGPSGTIQVLREADFPESLVAAVSAYRVLHLDKLQQQASGRLTAEEYQQDHALEFWRRWRRGRWRDRLWIVDGRLVRLLAHAGVSELREKWSVYAPAWIPNPVGAKLYLNAEVAAADGYHPPSTPRAWELPTVYNFIVRDASGRELWLYAPLQAGRWRVHQRGLGLVGELLGRCDLDGPATSDSLLTRLRTAWRTLSDPVLRFEPAVRADGIADVDA